jgi:hypothetical protein
MVGLLDGLMYGEITPIENAGQVNAYMTLNIRGKRSKTDPVDNDPKVMDALETARAQDEYFARTVISLGRCTASNRREGQLRHLRYAHYGRRRSRLC